MSGEAISYGELWEKPEIKPHTHCRVCGNGRSERMIRAKRPLARGLCPRCHNAATRDGTLEQVAAPKMPSRGRPIGSRALSADGYITVRTASGLMLEHRLVMKEILGREMLPGETAHHINGVKHDNRPENLELWFSPQPYGQRVSQLIPYLVEHHRQELLQALQEAA